MYCKKNIPKSRPLTTNFTSVLSELANKDFVTTLFESVVSFTAINVSESASIAYATIANLL